MLETRIRISWLAVAVSVAVCLYSVYMHSVQMFLYKPQGKLGTYFVKVAADFRSGDSVCWKSLWILLILRKHL